MAWLCFFFFKSETFTSEQWFGHKIQLFWEGHKNVRNRPYGFEIYLVNNKTIRTIAQIFVAFSEKLNFTRERQLVVKKKC